MKNIVNFRSTSNNYRIIPAVSVEFGNGMKHNFTYPLHAGQKSLTLYPAISSIQIMTQSLGNKTK
jgi:hypothetical protein